MGGFLQPDKRYTFLWDKQSKRPACVLIQALYGGDREICFVFPEWELAPTKTMVKVTGTGRKIEELADKLRTHEKQGKPQENERCPA